MMNLMIPKELHYSHEHEWVRVEKGYVTIGIDDYAQQALHEVVYVESPIVGKKVTFMEVLGTVESIKAVSEVFSPIAGEVVEVNSNLVTAPELVNQDPYGEGWIAKIRPVNLQTDLEQLMTADQYADYLNTLGKKSQVTGFSSPFETSSSSDTWSWDATLLPRREALSPHYRALPRWSWDSCMPHVKSG